MILKTHNLTSTMYLSLCTETLLRGWNYHFPRCLLWSVFLKVPKYYHTLATNTGKNAEIHPQKIFKSFSSANFHAHQNYSFCDGQGFQQSSYCYKIFHRGCRHRPAILTLHCQAHHHVHTNWKLRDCFCLKNQSLNNAVWRPHLISPEMWSLGWCYAGNKVEGN